MDPINIINHLLIGLAIGYMLAKILEFAISGNII